MHVHLASDHAGFCLKGTLAQYLQQQGHTFEDHGTHTQESCDYPTFAIRLCQAVAASGEPGMLLCGTGVGMCMVANRMPGIRAALCSCEFQARAARQHNNANVLCLGERVTGSELALSIADAFLTTAFAGGRHQRRLELFPGD